MEQLNIFSYILPQYKITKPIRLIELFAGIGSQAKALKNLGANFEHYRVVEWDKYAINSYNSVHGTTFTTSDITKIKGSDLGIVDTDKNDYLLTYSFPCQDLSIAGKLKGMARENNTRSGLLWEVERLLKEVDELPQYLLMENVPNVIGKKNIGDFSEWLSFLESLGYKNFYKILNAKDYGIPQNRKRCFMISILKNKNQIYEFPKPIPLTLKLVDMLEDEVDEKYFLSDTRMENHGTVTAVVVKSKPEFGRMGKQAVDTMMKNEVKLGDTINPYNRNVNISGIIPTITTRPEGLKTAILPIVQNKEYHTLAIRKLTPKECWRLMGFSDNDFDKASKVNSNAQLYKQAGNSIVVNVLMAIFKELL